MKNLQVCSTIIDLRSAESLTELPSVNTNLNVGGDAGHGGRQGEGRHEQHRVAELDDQPGVVREGAQDLRILVQHELFLDRTQPAATWREIFQGGREEGGVKMV